MKPTRPIRNSVCVLGEDGIVSGGLVPQIRGLTGCGLSLINKKWGSKSITPSQMQFRR